MNKKGKEGGSTWFNRRQTEIPLFKINKKKKKKKEKAQGRLGKVAVERGTLQPRSEGSAGPATMPRKKAAAAAWEEPSSGNGTARAGPRKRGGPAGRKRERPERCSSSSGGGSSGDEDGLELDGAPVGGKRAARPAAAKAGGAAVIITEPEHTKERVKLEGSKCKGQLLIFGATNWDLIGRKEVPKQQGRRSAFGKGMKLLLTERFLCSRCSVQFW